MRGGKREGAGRTPAPAGTIRVSRHIRLSPEADDLVQAMRDELQCSYTEALERLLLGRHILVDCGPFGPETDL